MEEMFEQYGEHKGFSLRDCARKLRTFDSALDTSKFFQYANSCVEIKGGYVVCSYPVYRPGQGVDSLSSSIFSHVRISHYRDIFIYSKTTKRKGGQLN